MFEFKDVADFYVSLINSLKKGTVTLESSLDRIILGVSFEHLAYVDNRKEAKNKGYDFWKGINFSALSGKSIGKNQFYSESQKFPDFVFRVREYDGKLVCGSLLETKDTSGGSISSFNSTIPTETKNMKEVDIINNGEIVSKITSIKDGKLAKNAEYYTYQRRCFYLIRTHRGTSSVKISLIDGSFFETVPKNYLISQMFVNILEKHHTKNILDIPDEKFDELKKLFNQITDQTIIAASQSIDKASVKPRLRIMAEVNPEGNPHSRHYPEIKGNTVNFILPENMQTKELQSYMIDGVPELSQFTLQHKRNGKYIVFEYKAG